MMWLPGAKVLLQHLGVDTTYYLEARRYVVEEKYKIHLTLDKM